MAAVFGELLVEVRNPPEIGFYQLRSGVADDGVQNPHAKRAEHSAPSRIELTHRPGLFAADALPFQILAPEVAAIIDVTVQRNTVLDEDLLVNGGYGIRTGNFKESPPKPTATPHVDKSGQPRSYELPSASHWHTAKHIENSMISYKVFERFNLAQRPVRDDFLRISVSLFPVARHGANRFRNIGHARAEGLAGHLRKARRFGEPAVLHVPGVFLRVPFTEHFADAVFSPVALLHVRAEHFVHRQRPEHASLWDCESKNLLARSFVDLAVRAFI